MIHNFPVVLLTRDEEGCSTIL